MKNSVFDNLISLKEASVKWKIDDSVLRRAIASGKLKDGDDAKKFGKQWVVLTSAMDREYGQISKISSNPTYSESKIRQIYYYQSEMLYRYAKKTKTDLNKASAIFQKLNIFKMIYDCYDYLHLGDTNDVIVDIVSRARRGIVYGG